MRNACPCGYYDDPVKPCTCSNMVVTKSRKRYGMIYQKRISGPLLGRVDINVEVPRVEYKKLSGTRYGESSEKLRARLEAAPQRQRQWFAVVGADGVLPDQIHPDRQSKKKVLPRF
jgi:magnesium chelatase family protein